MGKPPPSHRNLVPRRPSADFEHEEATTLDPFVIHDDELVVVPKAGSTEAIREDLRADPDVQDALRWLDPPSNAGPPLAAMPPVVPDGTGHIPPERHPSQPAYGQVYTPLPQPYPGAGPYPTPVPTYVPNSGAYYLATPMPGPAPMPSAPPARSPILWILLTAVVTGGGIALGWWMFSIRQQHNVAPAPAARAPVAPAPQPTHPLETPAPPAPPPPPKAEPVIAEVATLTRGEATAVMAPMSGQVSKVFLAAPGKVAAGDKLIELKTTSGGGAKAKKLAARVAELEKLAKDDPVYEEFLAQARKEQKAARGKVQTSIVKASAAGLASVEVKQGDEVTTGDPVAHVSKGGDWILTATAKREVQRSWPCSVALADDQKAACTIEKVIATPSGSDITARVVAADAPWLDGAANKPTLTLSPP